MSTWDDSWGAGQEAGCQHENTWFSRTICAEPCGSMHYVCVDCGAYSGGCVLEQIAAEKRETETALLAEVMDQLKWDLDEFPSPSLQGLVDRFDGYMKERK